MAVAGLRKTGNMIGYVDTVSHKNNTTQRCKSKIVVALSAIKNSQERRTLTIITDAAQYEEVVSNADAAFSVKIVI
jgi:hypothetical protein